ncbi:hypothetical protein IYW40_11635 [Methylocystis sp. H4A]|uniref:hypothetical protein n=1 Tax=Methylocystis sp. H4A TaxID=2785788 RepID=UPI0018C2ECC0|nr:hypothetical protein [Methylocystis sp. H4A]MBG0802125.1 hypothetical protein [Methylocystis sp. H4A]
MKKLARHRRITIRDRLAAIMRRAEPTPFAVEAPCRYGVRVALILQGWRWPEADAEAALLTQAALQLIGAKRPTWMMGQPEYCQDGVMAVQRERCVRCGKSVPDDRRLFCSDLCAKATHLDRQRERWNEENYAQWKSLKAAWIERQPEQKCPACGIAFRPKRLGQKFCRYECSNVDRRHTGRSMRPMREGL